MPSAIPMRGLRIDDELYLKLCEIAKRESRSFNKEAEYVLRLFVEAYEREHGEIKVDTDSLYQ